MSAIYDFLIGALSLAVAIWVPIACIGGAVGCYMKLFPATPKPQPTPREKWSEAKQIQELLTRNERQEQMIQCWAADYSRALKRGELWQGKFLVVCRENNQLRKKLPKPTTATSEREGK